MDGAILDEFDFRDHQNKCRLCIKSFNHDEHRIEINQQIEKKLREITELKLTDEFSKEICVVCSYQITKYCQFKRNVVNSQKQLYNFAAKANLEEQESNQIYVFFDDAIKQENDECAILIEHPNEGDEQDLIKEEVDEQSENLIKDEERLEAIQNHQTNIERRRKSGRVGSNSCPHCDIKIFERSQLKRHIERIHHKIKNFKCDQCDYKCYFKYALKSHMRTHIDKDERRTFSCSECNFVTVSKESLRAHNNQSHLTKGQSYECLICQITFDSYNQLYRHRLKSHKGVDTIAKYVCSFCGKSMTSASTLKNHISIFHSSEKPSLHCPFKGCVKVFITLKQLNKHKKSHDESLKEICSECGLVFANKTSLDKHTKRVHLKLKDFCCDLCDFKGCFKSNLAEHMIKHLDSSEREKYYCNEPDCVYQTLSKTSLRSHYRSEHLGEKKTYICHCGKNFTLSGSFQAHVKFVHEKQKSHNCKFCSKSFFVKSVLNKHIKINHLKQRDFPCEICKKNFATKTYLRGHMKYHEEPQFCCNFENCTSSFFTSQMLTSHIKVHNNQRDFKCPVHLCEKSYFHKSHLKKHLLIHGIHE